MNISNRYNKQTDKQNKSKTEKYKKKWIKKMHLEPIPLFIYIKEKKLSKSLIDGYKRTSISLLRNDRLVDFTRRK